MIKPGELPQIVDVAIVGGGPAGLAAALALGRACRSAVVFDDGPPRNARATSIHNFVTRDGTPPAEFRRLATEQLAEYPSVSVRRERVSAIEGARDRFEVTAASATILARRVVLCTGMVDELLDIPGFEAAWGHSIFQCPYCHGWEVRDRRWGYLALDLDGLRHGFPAMLRGWTEELVIFGGGLDVPADIVADLAGRGIAFLPGPVAELVVDGSSLTHVVLQGGRAVPCEALFAHPPQRHLALVSALGLELDQQGYVQIDPMTRQTSLPGIYAAGDLTTRAQGAIFAAATGTQAAAMANHDLCLAGPLGESPH